LKTAGYLLFAASGDGKAAREVVRRKIAFLFRNLAMKDNIEATGVIVDQDRVIDAISRRELDEAATFISDEAVDAYGVAGTPEECRKRIRDYIDAGIEEPILLAQGEGAERTLALEVLREFTSGGAGK
jgi:alkanesulfonate monooxygenase SsuD/methylene tetrahydromethanopterin reductase-like flavin-dependent oxidoreductase (luciferase family)